MLELYVHVSGLPRSAQANSSPQQGELSEPVAARTWAGAPCFRRPDMKPSRIGAWAAAGSILGGVSVNRAAFACVMLGTREGGLKLRRTRGTGGGR